MPVTEILIAGAIAQAVAVRYGWITQAQACPSIAILLNLTTAAVLLSQGDIKRAIYWLAAATLTSTVTF
jgi:hypothetical protein